MIALQEQSKECHYALAEKVAINFKDNPAFKLWAQDEVQRIHVLTEFFNIVLEILIEKEMVYTTSERMEGFCGFWTKQDGFKMRHKLKLAKILKHIKFGDLLNVIKQQVQIKGAEHQYRKEKDYLFVFMVVVDESYRGRGFMRQIMSFIFNYAKERNLLCILETDSRRNEAIYQHYGMLTTYQQELTDELTYYILAYDANLREELTKKLD